MDIRKAMAGDEPPEQVDVDNLMIRRVPMCKKKHRDASMIVIALWVVAVLVVLSMGAILL